VKRTVTTIRAANLRDATEKVLATLPETHAANVDRTPDPQVFRVTTWNAHRHTFRPLPGSPLMWGCDCGATKATAFDLPPITVKAR
jgi:hypothetical protein